MVIENLFPKFKFSEATLRIRYIICYRYFIVTSESIFIIWCIVDNISLKKLKSRIQVKLLKWGKVVKTQLGIHRDKSK